MSDTKLQPLASFDSLSFRNMKLYLHILFPSFFLLLSLNALAQKRKHVMQQPDSQHIDSMFVNLYTDSLKKGTYNYINIVGKLNNGRYLPLDTSQVAFTSSDGKFFGNSLWLDQNFNKEKVTIKAMLKNDPRQEKEFKIYIKKAPDPELKSEDQILNDLKQGRKRG